MHPLSDGAGIFLTSTVVCLSTGRLAIQWLTRVQCLAPVRYQDCPPLLAHQAAKVSTPTMGGLLVLGIGMIVAAMTGGLAHQNGRLVCGSVLAFAAVGLADDYLKFRTVNATGVRGRPKLLLTLAIGAALGAASSASPGREHGLQGLWFPSAADLGWWWIPFSMLVMTGCAHAVNLTDGLDGLAAGCVAITLSVLGIWAFAGDGPDRVMGVWCASLAGACVGFLWFNSHPASVFLGDVGALGLGAAVGAISLLTQSALWLPLIGGVFVVEALSVMLQVASYKWRGKRRVFRVAPLHHHFQLGGMSDPKLIARFWIAGLLLGVAGLALMGAP